MRHVWLPVVIALSACGAEPDVAILEVTIELPLADSTEEIFAHTEAILGADTTFDQAWDGEFPAGVALDALETRVDVVSIVSDAVDSDVWLRVRFCRDAFCLSGTPIGEARFELTKPFCPGQARDVNLQVDTLERGYPPLRPTMRVILPACLEEGGS